MPGTTSGSSSRLPSGSRAPETVAREAQRGRHADRETDERRDDRDLQAEPESVDESRILGDREEPLEAVALRRKRRDRLLEEREPRDEDERQQDERERHAGHAGQRPAAQRPFVDGRHAVASLVEFRRDGRREGNFHQVLAEEHVAIEDLADLAQDPLAHARPIELRRDVRQHEVARRWPIVPARASSMCPIVKAANVLLERRARSCSGTCGRARRSPWRALASSRLGPVSPE